MTDQEAIELFRQAVVQPDRSLVAQIKPNAWVKLQFTAAMCVSPNCQGEKHDESEFTIYQNQHFILHDVVAIEVKRDYGDGRIRVRAHTAQGDACEGMAADVLRRLSEPAMGQTMAVPPPMRMSEPVIEPEPIVEAEPVAESIVAPFTDTRSWIDRLLGG